MNNGVGWGDATGRIICGREREREREGGGKRKRDRVTWKLIISLFGFNELAPRVRLGSAAKVFFFEGFAYCCREIGTGLGGFVLAFISIVIYI